MQVKSHPQRHSTSGTKIHEASVSADFQLHEYTCSLAQFRLANEEKKKKKNNSSRLRYCAELTMSTFYRKYCNAFKDFISNMLSVETRVRECKRAGGILQVILTLSRFESKRKTLEVHWEVHCESK